MLRSLRIETAFYHFAALAPNRKPFTDETFTVPFPCSLALICPASLCLPAERQCPWWAKALMEPAGLGSNPCSTTWYVTLDK